MKETVRHLQQGIVFVSPHWLVKWYFEVTKRRGNKKYPQKHPLFLLPFFYQRLKRWSSIQVMIHIIVYIEAIELVRIICFQYSTLNITRIRIQYYIFFYYWVHIIWDLACSTVKERVSPKSIVTSRKWYQECKQQLTPIEIKTHWNLAGMKYHFTFYRIIFHCHVAGGGKYDGGNILILSVMHLASISRYWELLAPGCQPVHPLRSLAKLIIQLESLRKFNKKHQLG